MQELSVYAVSLITEGSDSLVVLKAADANRFLLLPVELSEGVALALELESDSGECSPRSDFASRLLEELFGEVCYVFTELHEQRLRSVIVLGVGDAQLEIVARPGEVLAVALRSGAPIYASDELVLEASVDLGEGGLFGDELLLAEFREFLDQIDPGDFS